MTPFQEGFTIFTVGSVPLITTLYYGVRKCQDNNLPYDSDDLMCACGNTPHTDGFYHCSPDGVMMEPVIGGEWQGHYYCDRCGQVHLLDGGN